jgi:hypothetical protein
MEPLEALVAQPAAQLHEEIGVPASLESLDLGVRSASVRAASVVAP